MYVSICVSTWNRDALLDQTLTRMRKLKVPPDVDWELIVVNNNCTDDTDQIIASHAAYLPLRRLFEAQPGLSNARNCAIDAARGDFILWTDDDVLADSDWLTGYCRAVAQWPSTSFFGGPILPWFEAAPPKWLNEVWNVVSNAYATRDFGSESIELSQFLVPFGANFGIRTEVQRRYRYDPRLGRRRGNVMGGEETTVIRAMLADGLKGRWVPDARVHHFIPRVRQTTAYLRRFSFAQGVYTARMVMDRPSVPMLFGKPRWLWRLAVEDEIRYRFRRILCSPPTWIQDLIRSSEHWGQLLGYTQGESEATGTDEV